MPQKSCEVTASVQLQIPNLHHFQSIIITLFFFFSRTTYLLIVGRLIPNDRQNLRYLLEKKRKFPFFINSYEVEILLVGNPLRGDYNQIKNVFCKKLFLLSTWMWRTSFIPVKITCGNYANASC